MSFTYEQKKKQENKKNGAEPFGGSGKESSLPNSAQLADLGHQVDMPTVMREKMEGAFGMDLSSVKLYENRAVGDAGAEAVTQGSKIAFAPGKLDFSSTRGQALLGHEISHVASQARGEVKGSGFLNDSALEARADSEGMMAAHGENVSGNYGGASAPLSNASAASAAGPMQAKSGKRNNIIDEAQPEQQNPNANLIDTSHMIPERSTGGKIMDWFRTVGAHWFTQSKDLKNLHKQKDAYEREQMFSNKEAEEDAELDNWIDDAKQDKEAKKKIVKLIGDDDEVYD